MITKLEWVLMSTLAAGSVALPIATDGMLPLAASAVGLLTLGGIVLKEYREFNPEPDPPPVDDSDSIAGIQRKASEDLRAKILGQRAATQSGAPVPKAKEVVDVTEAQAEGAVLGKELKHTYGFSARVEWRKLTAIITTPTSTLYPVVELSTINQDALEDKLEDLARPLAKYRKYRGTPVRIHLLKTQPLYLAVSREHPETHPWAARTWQRRTMRTCIGDVWRGPTQEAVTLDLGGEACTLANGLFCGQPRSGKSRDVHIALLGLLESTKASDLHVYAIDMNSSAYKQYEGLPQFRGHYSQEEEILPLLQQFAWWCTAQGAPTDKRHRLLVFDEFQLASQNANIGKQVNALMETIMSAGAKYGIRVWVVTQVPDKACYSTRLRALTQFVVAHTMQQDGYVVQQFHIQGSRRLQAQHECILLADGQQKLVTTFWLPDKEMAQAVQALKASNPPEPAGIPTPELPEPKPELLGHRSASLGVIPGKSSGISAVPAAQSRVMPINLCKLPFKSASLSEAETAYAIDQIIANREVCSTAGELSQTKICNFIFGKKNNVLMAVAKELKEKVLKEADYGI